MCSSLRHRLPQSLTQLSLNHSNSPAATGRCHLQIPSHRSTLRIDLNSFKGAHAYTYDGTPNFPLALSPSIQLVHRLLTHQNLLLYSSPMVASALSTKKAVALFHALSDETRLALLDRLKDGEQCVCELMDSMKATQSRLSFHLKVLKDAGLVEDRREGRWMYYSLSSQALEELEDLVDSLKKAAKSAVSSTGCC